MIGYRLNPMRQRRKSLDRLWGRGGGRQRGISGGKKGTVPVNEVGGGGGELR